MANEIQIFENPEFGTIRTVMMDGEPWFVGKDVASVLGYRNASKAVMTHVDDEDKRFEMFEVSDSQNGNLVKTAIINESGLYSLVLSSKLPAAKQFKRWVTNEVLPSIRKHGAYMTKETLTESLARPENLMVILQTLLEEQKKNEALTSKVEQDKPKVAFAEAVYDCDTLISVADLAKLVHANGVNIGQKRMYDFLRDEGFLCKRIGEDWNTPLQRYLDMGLFAVKEYSYPTRNGWGVSKTTKITGKGQTYLVNYILARKDDINAQQKMARKGA